jgi:hypothetical protein
VSHGSPCCTSASEVLEGKALFQKNLNLHTPANQFLPIERVVLQGNSWFIVLEIVKSRD